MRVLVVGGTGVLWRSGSRAFVAARAPGPRALTVGRQLEELHGQLDLRSASDDLRVEVRLQRRRSTTSALLRDVREKPEMLLDPDDSSREPRDFELTSN